MPSYQALMAAQGEPEVVPFPADASSWRVMICLLGEFKVLFRDEPHPVRCSGKTGSLLRLLALRPCNFVSRDTLLDLLWPDAESDLAVQSLNSLVYGLHKLLGPHLDGASPLIIREGLYRLNCEAGLLIDVGQFEELAESSEKAAQAENYSAAVDLASQAVQLYHGDLINSGDWSATLELERLRSVFLSLLARLADDSFRNGDYFACLGFARRLLAYDACREDAHRIVMRCYVRRGERAAALHQYDLCCSILASEYDALPEPATVALYDMIRVSPLQV